MKKIKIVLVVLCTVFAMLASAQDSTFAVKKLYVGLLPATSFSVDSFHVSKWASARVGAWGMLNLSKKFDVQSWVAYQVETSGTEYALTAFWADYKPDSSWKISFGNLPTPIAEFRPHPVSGDGQFETWTEALLPGVSTGAKVAFTHDKFETKLGASFTNKGKFLASGKLTVGQIGVGGFVGEGDVYGGTIVWDAKHFYTIAVITDKNIGNFLSIRLGNDWCLYSDAGIERPESVAGETHSYNCKKLVRGEWGIIKNFSVKDWSGLLALGYAYEARTINAYLFVHI